MTTTLPLPAALLYVQAAALVAAAPRVSIARTALEMTIDVTCRCGTGWTVVWVDCDSRWVQTAGPDPAVIVDHMHSHHDGNLSRSATTAPERAGA